MKKTIGIAIGVIVVVFLILGIARTRKKEDVKSITKIQQEEGVPVFAETVKPGDVRSLQTYYGTVRSKDQALVASKLMERVEKIYVREGDHVKKGDPLVQFDASHSQAMVAQAKLQYENARRDYNRMKKLMDEGAISQQTFDQVRLGYRVAKENYETAQSSVELTAPISGMVARVNFTVGVMANPGDIVVQIVNDKAYEVEFEATQDDRDLLKPGLPVIVRTKTGVAASGRLTKVSYASSEMTRLFSAYADVPGTADIFPGVLATVDVVVQERKNVVAVPIESIIDRGNGSMIAVIVDGVAHLRSVKTGITGADRIEIVEGLKPGDVIATYGQRNIEDGQKVKIIQEAKTESND